MTLCSLTRGFFDGASAECAEGMGLLIADGCNQEVSDAVINAPGARVIVAERGACIVPTLVIGLALATRGPELGFPASSQEKAEPINITLLAAPGRHLRAIVRGGEVVKNELH